MNRNAGLVTVNINTICEHLHLLLDEVCLFTWASVSGGELKSVFLVLSGFKLEYFGTWGILIKLFSYWFLLICI